MANGDMWRPQGRGERKVTQVKAPGFGLIDIADFTRHGGALDLARQRFPHAPQPWLDLSTGINPIAYPIGMIADGAWTRLPEAGALAHLEQVAARQYGVPGDLRVVAAPGAQSIIQSLPAICDGRDVRVLGRTYEEYARVFRSADAKVQVVPNVAALAGADTAVVVNPNNPDGRLVPADDLILLSRRVGLLVVDEAFADPVGGQSIVSRLPADRIIVLRSFGKIYGLAGLRLGFAIAPPSKAAALRRHLGPWAVSGPALQIGAAALTDTAWLTETRTRLKTDGARLMFLLGHVGASSVGATSLFRLVQHPAAPALFRWLATRGILCRPFAEEPLWLRFGLPGPEADWARLESALLTFR